MGKRDDDRGTSPRGESPTHPAAYFRGWFLALIVGVWVLGGVGMVVWGVRGCVALALVAALLVVVDARGLFTLQGRLAWGKTGPTGRAVLTLVLVALLPLVVSFYLVVAVVRYRRGKRLRAASRPMGDTATVRKGEIAATLDSAAADTSARPMTRSTPQAISQRTSRPMSAVPSSPVVAPVTRPLASSLPPLRSLSVGGAGDTLATTPENDIEDDASALATARLTVAPSSAANTQQGHGTPRERGRRALLVGCLAAGVGILLLSCGMLAFAGPLRLFGSSDVHSTAQPPSALHGQGAGAGRAGATASATTAPSTLTHAATPTETPTPTATATATPSTPAASTPAASTPTPRSIVAPTPRATQPPAPRPTPKPTPRPRPTPTTPPAWQQPSWQTPPSWPPPTPIFNPPPWQTGYDPGATAASNAGPLRVTFSCALSGSDAAESICFNAPPGQRIDVEIAFRCVDPYLTRERISKSLTAASDGALEWTWSPKRACQVGRAHVLVRTRDGDRAIELRATVATGNWP